MTKKRKQPESLQRRTERHLGMPWDQWRQKKRQEWKDILNAIDRFNVGCAYTPAHRELYEVQRIMRRITEDMAHDWVSW